VDVRGSLWIQLEAQYFEVFGNLPTSRSHLVDVNKQQEGDDYVTIITSIITSYRILRKGVIFEGMKQHLQRQCLFRSPWPTAWIAQRAAPVCSPAHRKVTSHRIYELPSLI
jgi:hypothetical protein